MLAWLALAALSQAAPPPTVRQETRRLLERLIEIDTSNPPGNEARAASLLKKELDREGIESEVYVSTAERGSLIARLRADAPTGRPLLLMCHTDVVPAERRGWRSDPFVPVVRDGRLYGRGAADIKSMCAAQAAALLELKRRRVPLARDVIFFAEADEEVGGPGRHIEWLLARHGEKLDAEYGINEGGQTVFEAGRVVEIRVQAAEKEFVDVELVARGTAGHSSVPRRDNPVAALARAVARLADHRWPVRLEPVARRFFEAQLSEAAPSLRGALEAALAAKTEDELASAADALAGLKPDFAAMLRDTVAPTILEAGYKSNIVPAEARAVLNARLLPGRDPQAFAAEVEKVVADPSVEVRLSTQSRPPVAAMPPDGPVFDAVAAAAAERAPGARVLPFLAAWSTDSADLRARGVKVYGVDPPLTAEDEVGVHGDDERIELAALDWYADFLYDVVVRLAASPAPGAKAR